MRGAENGVVGHMGDGNHGIKRKIAGMTSIMGSWQRGYMELSGPCWQGKGLPQRSPCVSEAEVDGKFQISISAADTR